MLELWLVDVTMRARDMSSITGLVFPTDVVVFEGFDIMCLFDVFHRY